MSKKFQCHILKKEGHVLDNEPLDMVLSEMGLNPKIVRSNMAHFLMNKREAKKIAKEVSIPYKDPNAIGIKKVRVKAVIIIEDITET